MTDVNFTKILDKLKEIHSEFPELRFGAIIQNAINTSKMNKNFDLNNITSKEILKSITGFQEITRKKRGNSNGE